MPRTGRDVITGRVVAPFGIRGELKLLPLTDFPDRFDAGRSISLKLQTGERREARIRRSQPYKGGVIIKIDGVDTRNEAESLRGAESVIDESELAELDAGSFYLFDVIGLKVVTDDGRELGEITEVLQNSANDVYITGDGLCIPALKSVVVNINVEAGVMTIHPVPGLLAE